MLNVFAHANEAHETLTQSAAHNLIGTWYFALPLFLLLVVLAALVSFKLSKGSYAVTYNVVLGVMFVSGVLTYSLSAPVSVAALSIGFAMALLSALTAIGSPS